MKMRKRKAKTGRNVEPTTKHDAVPRIPISPLSAVGRFPLLNTPFQFPHLDKPA